MVRGISFKIKCGTGGHWDEDGCDLLLRDIDEPSNDFVIPRIGETVKLRNKDVVYGFLEYQVQNVIYIYVGTDDTNDKDDVFIEIAVVPIGHSISRK